ncbi:MAG: hypothetical protein JXA72_11175 [Bacteroidales bacterium]|nr:hypothetical protein [Bacteroidales bacterium]
MTKNQVNLVLRFLPVALIGLVSGMGMDHHSDTFVDELKEKLQLYNNNFLEERAFLMTDRFVYRPGEELWFKGIVSSRGLIPMQVNSKDLFIKLINTSGQEVIYRRYPLFNNMSAGRLIIPKSTIPGKYWLVAYTGWMKNGCPEEAFRKEILVSKYYEKRFVAEVNYNRNIYYAGDTLKAIVRIVDQTGKPVANTDFDFFIGTYSESKNKGNGTTDAEGSAFVSGVIPETDESLMLSVAIRNRKLSGEYAVVIPSVTSEPVVSFHAEGGRLVQGLDCIMAVHVTNKTGLPALIKGDVVDQYGNPVHSLKTEVNGKCKFHYTPSGDSCFLKITEPSGIHKKFPLPLAEKKGFVISLLEQSYDSVKFQVVASEHFTPLTYWVAVLNSQIVWSQAVDLRRYKTVSLSVKDFPEGLLQVTVFDEEYKPRADRLVRIGEKSGKFNIKSDLPVYKSRQRVNLMIECPDGYSNVNLSIAVALQNLSFNSRGMDFASSFDAHYSKGDMAITNKPDLIEDIDLITTQYKPIIWEDVLADNSNRKPYERNDGLSGKVMDKKENVSELAKIRVTHIPNYRTYETQSDGNGEFRVEFGSDLIDFKYLNIDAYDALGKTNLTAVFDQDWSGKLKSLLITETENKERQKALDILSYGEPDLVYVLRYGPGKFRSVNDRGKKYDPNHYASYRNVPDIIQDIKPYHLIDNRIVFDDEPGGKGSKGAIIAIDGSLRGNHVAVIESLSPSDITKIRISTSPLDVQKYTSLNFVSVIEINTIQGRYRYRQPTIQLGTDAFFKEKEFHSPNYTFETTNSVDNRKTLYWNSNLTIRSGNPLLVTFYTSDIKGVYNCQLIGVDADGRKIEGTHQFRVE